MRHAISKFANNIALVTSDGQFTYTQLGERVLRLATHLKNLGVEPGTHVFSLLNDSLAQVEVRLATYELGASLTAFNAGHPTAQIISAGRLVQPTLFMYDPAISNMPARFFEGNLPETKLLPVNADYNRILETDVPSFAGSETSGRDIATMRFIFEEGAEPRALYFTQESVMKGVQQSVGELGFARHKEMDITLAGIPFSDGGEDIILPVLSNGGIIVLPECLDMSVFLEMIGRYRISRMLITASQFIDFLEDTEQNQYDLNSLKQIIYSGGPLAPAKFEEALKRFGPVFRQVYQIPEFQSFVSTLRIEQHLRSGHSLSRRILASVGRMNRGMSVRIIGRRGKELPTGQIGEIVIAGPTMFNGYWKRADLTRKLVTDACHHTGNLGFVDKDGLLHVLNRRREVYQRDERWVYPRQIENVLHKHPSVRDVCLVRDESLDKITLCVTLRQSWRKKRSWPEISRLLWQHLNQNLDDELLPDSLVYMPDLPRSYAGQIIRQEVRAMLRKKRNTRTIPEHLFGNPAAAGPVIHTHPMMAGTVN
ncbi:MAG: acyl--CoA ligase [Calditrichaeota bacterium]|nr:acyl--CoA ligase [Calditrichota bacterium]